jgi:hypothetical protein
MRRAATTPEERQQVFELVDAHALSDREVAEIVFGDARYHGRVRRLLERRDRAVELPPSPPPAAELNEFDRQTVELEVMTKRMKQQVASDLLAGNAEPGKLEAVNRLEIQIEQRRMFSRMRELTREPD